MRKYFYVLCIFLLMLLLVSCGEKSDSTKDAAGDDIAVSQTNVTKDDEQITPKPEVTATEGEAESIQQSDITDKNDETEDLTQSSEEEQSKQSDIENENATKYYPIGIDLDEFVKRFNETISDCEGYQLENLDLTEGDTYNTFEHKFLNKEVITGIVNKNGDFLYLKYVYPAKGTSDKDLIYARQMVCASSIIAFTQNSATTDIAVEQSTAIMKQLSIIKDDEDIYNKYLNEELLTSVCDGIKYTRQFNKETGTSCFTLSTANEAAGEKETVNITYEVTSAIKKAEDSYTSSKGNGSDKLTGWEKYQKQALEFYANGQKDVPSGWIEYNASVSWLLDDIANGVSIYYNGAFYTPEARLDDLSVMIDNVNESIANDINKD